MNRFIPFALLAIMTGCSRQEVPVAAAGVQQPAIAQKIETVVGSPVAEQYRASGTVRARYTVAIAARIAANISEIRVETGDHVRAGQTLVVLDNRDLAANLRRAEAARSEAESAISETEQTISAASANLELLRVTHKRFEDLLAQTSVSRQEVDESQARLKSATAALEVAISKRRQAEARRSQTDAEIVGARVASGYAALVAPFNGVVTERKADPGSLALPGAPLLTLEKDGNLRLEVSIDESRIDLVRRGLQVTVEIDGLNRTASGHVAEVVPSVDSATRSFTTKIDLPALPGLRAGMFGRAIFTESTREALLIPQSAILERGQTRFVYAVDADTARLRFVTLGQAIDNRREVLSGLNAGEKIVTAPSPAVTDGRRLAREEAAR